MPSNPSCGPSVSQTTATQTTKNANSWRRSLDTHMDLRFAIQISQRRQSWVVTGHTVSALTDSKHDFIHHHHSRQVVRHLRHEKVALNGVNSSIETVDNGCEDAVELPVIVHERHVLGIAGVLLPRFTLSRYFQFLEI